jgi:opacity protein-like surface antigen
MPPETPAVPFPFSLFLNLPFIMKSLFAVPLIAASLLCALPSAQAHWFDGHNYVALELGNNRASQQDLYQSGFNFVNIGFDNGFDATSARGIAFGRALSLGPRMEFAYNERSNDIATFGNRLYDGGGALSGQGRERLRAWQINLWYDLDLQPLLGLPLSPYLGLGTGQGRIDVENLAAGGVSFGDANADVWVRQWGLGVAWAVTEHIHLDLGYRRVRTSVGNFGSIPNIPPGDVDARYRAGTTQLGLRWHF